MAATDDFNQLRDSYLDFLREEVSDLFSLWNYYLLHVDAPPSHHFIFKTIFCFYNHNRNHNSVSNRKIAFPLPSTTMCTAPRAMLEELPGVVLVSKSKWQS